MSARDPGAGGGSRHARTTPTDTGLLFAVAAMELRRVAATTALVTLEKVLPRPHFRRHPVGVVFMGTACAFALGCLTLQGISTQ